MEDLQNCPICLEVPEQEIYQCKAGHIICHSCVSKVSGRLCPQCRVPFGREPIRSRILERILDAQQFKCKFIDKGCAHLCKREEITTHANSCSYNPDAHPLCQQLGFKNSIFRIGCVSRSDILTHFAEVHKRCLQIGESFYIKGNFIKHGLNRKRKVGETEFDFQKHNFLVGIFTPEDCDTSPLFLVSGRISKLSGYVSFLCIQLWDSESEPRKQYKAEFTFNRVPSPSSSNSPPKNGINPFPIGGSMKVCSIKEAGYLVNEGPLNFRIALLMQACFGDNIEDYIHLTISKIPEPAPVPECLQLFLQNSSSSTS